MLNRSKVAVSGAILSALVLAQSASAALPAEVTGAFTGISTNATDLSAIAWPVIASVTGMFILVKLFKRFTGKV